MPNHSLKNHRALITVLADAIAAYIAAFYDHPERPDDGNDSVYCVLTALAANVGAIIAGTGAPPVALKVFIDAVTIAIDGSFKGDEQNGQTTKH